jgi:hypothetical protein
MDYFIIKYCYQSFEYNISIISWNNDDRGERCDLHMHSGYGIGLASSPLDTTGKRHCNSLQSPIVSYHPLPLMMEVQLIFALHLLPVLVHVTLLLLYLSRPHRPVLMLLLLFLSRPSYLLLSCPHPSYPPVFPLLTPSRLQWPPSGSS